MKELILSNKELIILACLLRNYYIINTVKTFYILLNFVLKKTLKLGIADVTSIDLSSQTRSCDWHSLFPSPYNSPRGTVTVLILKMRKLRRQEVESFVQAWL